MYRGWEAAKDQVVILAAECRPDLPREKILIVQSRPVTSLGHQVGRRVF